MRNDRPVRSTHLLTTTLTVLSAFAGSVEGQEPGAAQLSGPITGGQRGEAHGALGAAGIPPGYAESEWFLSGVAASYEKSGPWGLDGVWSVSPAGTAPFAIRLLARRPIEASAFNGVVVVEWLNVSSQSEGAADYSQMAEELVREGYAWVGVGAQAVGVNAPGTGLKAWDPERYAPLSHPGDRFSYDIFSLAARTLRTATPGSGHPLAGLELRHLVATGRSQSAFRLVTYLNAIHPRDPLFDGYFIHSRGGNAAGLTAEGLGGDTDPPIPAGARIRTDLDVPVFDLQTEGDMVALRSHLTRQPASDRYRRWEIAGAAHAEVPRWIVAESPPLSTGPGCALPVNAAPHDAFVKAGLRAFTRWVTTGQVPPQSPDIEIGDPTAADPIVRDEFGNARGGIRIPHVEAPTGALDGRLNSVAPPAPAGLNFCFLFGTTQAFDAETLRRLYPDRNDFLTRYITAVDALVRDGYLLGPEAAAARLAALESTIGR